MSVTLIIIIVTCAISIYGFNNQSLVQKWIFNAHHIKYRNEYWRFLTSGFIHKDWTHLGFNMFTLYFLGNGIEQTFQYLFPNNGVIIFIAFYLTAIIISSIPTFLKNRENIHYNSLGASGGVSALVFCFIIVYPIVDLCLFGILCLPGFILGTVYLIYTIQMGRNKMDRINHDAHLWGALYGCIFLLFSEPDIYISFFEQLMTWRPFQ